ncbi:MAG: alpha/beta hydrolase [Halanaerobium sp.]|nr:alpha/beta hydrolase [Halanaerobium sp.]
MESISFVGKDGVNISGYRWLDIGDMADPRGVVQIAHGMAEHAARYDHFARFLNRQGYLVYANDHRGHGRTAGQLEGLGFFAEEAGWELAVADLKCLTGVIKDQHPRLPIFLFGHSMGSLLARDYLFSQGDELAGAILSGTSGDPGFLNLIALGLARLEILFRGKKARSKLLNSLSFGSFNKAFQPARTDFDWLSRDEGKVDEYIADPYCGGLCTAGFFQDLFHGLRKINKKENLQKVPTELPVLVFSGEKDPVGGFTVGVKQVVEDYIDAGLTNINCRFYPDGRHEMLNELNREEVYRDLVDWLDENGTAGSGEAG